MSDTPRTDAGLEYDDTTVDDVKDFARTLERELNAANERIKRLEEELNELRSDEAGLLKYNEELERRINRLEGAKDLMEKYIFDQTNTRFIKCAIQWRKAKEAKP
jgi:septal ring factor EnvC (AmiA/AmiB activator)